MVTDSHTRSDRAQLVLIAAIALAFIILGIVVVFNSVLYTQTMSSSSSIETTSDAQLAELEMARGVRGIAQEVNLDNESINNIADVNDTLEDNSSAFVGQYRNATVERRPAIVDLSIGGVGTEARATDSSIPDNVPERLVFDGINRSSKDIGHFVLRLNSSENVTVRAINESGVSSEIEITSNGDLEIDDLDNGCSVEPMGDIVIFDFTTGTIIDGDSGDTECSIRLIDPDDSYNEIEFGITGGENSYYELVARGNSPLSTFSNEGHLAAWTVDLEYTYDTSELTVDRQFEVDVYGDRR